MPIVDVVKALCKNSNMSVLRLEKEIGFAEGTIKRWDTNRPSIDKVQAVADYFGVSVDYLLGREALREKYNIPDGMDVESAVEAIHKNPKLKILFSRSAKMNDEDLDFMLQLADRINRENEDGI